MPFLKNVRGIKSRWLINNLGYVILVIILGVSVFAAGTMNYYYSNIRENLTNRAIINSRYFNDNINVNFSTFYSNARRQTMEFTDRDMLERQILYPDGRIMFSSSGLPTGMLPGTPDIEDSVRSYAVKTFTGNDPLTGERIMSVSSPLVTDSNKVIGVMRFVTSLREVDKQILIRVGIAILVGILILFFVSMSNRYFMRSIINPLREIIDITKKITEGSYGVRIEKKFDDEIGELCDTINEMSMEISRAEKMKNDFISSVSHELRTPLTAIIGWGETLVAVGMDDPDEARKGLKVMLKETRRLSKMVEELLDFARMESGRFNLCMERMDLKAEFEETLYMYKETFKKDGIEIKYDTCEADIFINGDRERLKQVFFNILDNAVKHGKDGGKIDISVGSADDKANIIIKDYGAEIPEDELPYVKLKFYKGTSKSSGSGIGLAVSDEIVKLHGGELRIESAVGKGTTVTIIIPLSVANEEIQ